MSQQDINESNNRFILNLQSRIAVLESELKITILELDAYKQKLELYKKLIKNK